MFGRASHQAKSRYADRCGEWNDAHEDEGEICMRKVS